MDFLRFSHPWILAAIIPVWAALLAAGARPGARRPGTWGRLLLAGVAAGLLLVSLASPAIRVSSTALGAGRVCLVEDVSNSMALARRAPPAEVLAGCVQAFPEKGAGLVQFAGTLGTVVDPAGPDARRLASPATFPPDAGPGLTDSAMPETDIAAGLARAGSLLPPGEGLIVLYTDGRETRGDARQAARTLAARGVQVHVLQPDLAAPPDVRLVSVAPLSQAAAGQRVRLQVRLASTAPADAEVRVARRSPPEPGAAPVRAVQVPVGPLAGATLLFEDAPPGPGLYAYTASLVSAADRVRENNEASCMVRVGGVREVVYVFAGEKPRPALEWLRAHAPSDVRLSAVAVPQARGLPDPSADLVVLDNVSSWALGRQTEELLASRVTRGGLGLLVLGGDAGFGAGGYGYSPLESLLPVSSRTRERPPLAMVLVVDSSGSMNEKVDNVQKLTLAKQAILTLRGVLGEGDRVGIVAFTGQPRVVSEPVPASQWNDLERRLLALQAGGGTRITPALEAALSLLGPAPKEGSTVRHVLLLSDGRSEDFALDRLAAACRAAAVTVSTVATGVDADLQRLRGLAEGTGGHLYRPDDLSRLAETFFKDLAHVRGEGLREEARAARWVDPDPVWQKAGPPLPDIPAFNMTRAKEGAAVHWAAVPPKDQPGGEAPLLASWRRGIGKVAAMPWPVSAASGPWVADDRLGRSLGDVLAYLAGPRGPTDWTAEIVAPEGSREHGANRRVRVERRALALEDPTEGFAATIFIADRPTPEEIVLPQVAPGVFEADLGREGAAASLVVVHATKGGPGDTVHLSVPGAPPREYAAFGVDRDRLDEIAQAGGGQVHESAESVARVAAHLHATGFTPVGIHFVWAAALVVAAQILLRLTGRL